MLISVDWVPPYLCPSRRLLRSRGEDRSLVTLPKIAPIPGPRLRRWREIVITVSALRSARSAPPSGGQRDEAGDGPGEGCHLSRNGHHDLVGVLAPGDQPPVAFSQAYLRLPADGLLFPTRPDFNNIHAGHFLIDRQAIVRWVWIETPADDLTRYGVFPTDDEILAAVRAATL